ncbi:hypothetical protein GIB67_029995 [Kingdonia uniflora]|uniref:Uncharacterized protein n=1 Tax=Kingdonia uniflora TaxID=39325 RepID=A0A7J7MY19_9MAGN|nr:hypothetical protein GIB67_029995 [Kingdonia uniflora]
MARILGRSKADSSVFVGGAFVAFLLILGIWYYVYPDPTPTVTSLITKNPLKTVYGSTSEAEDCADSYPLAQSITLRVEHCPDNNVSAQGFNMREESTAQTFYDDPDVTYTIEKPMKNWDEKRVEWINHHPSFATGVEKRILVVSGSQNTPCKNQIGDHILLRFFKNKVDYCRIHGYDIFYNNVLLHPKMPTFWAKIPLVRAAMIAHPEVEWIWWIDSDAAFTDMDFKLPLDKYKDYNLIVHGWSHLIYEEKSWVGLNAGIFLIRNCQWSMDFMDVWASMGPQTPDFDKWGEILRSTFKTKVEPESDDQSGLVYLLLKEKKTWGKKIFLESEYYFEGYWVEIVGRLDSINDKYVDIEKQNRKLGRRHAEKVSEYYAELRGPYLKESGYAKDSWKRPFITHFAGCQPCSGNHNQMYSGESCWDGMQKVLNFADNQVLQKFGFVHKNLQDSASVLPIPFVSTS